MPGNSSQTFAGGKASTTPSSWPMATWKSPNPRPATLVSARVEGTQTRGATHFNAFPCSQTTAGVTKAWLSPSRGHSWPAGALAPCEGFLQYRPHELGRGLDRIRVEDGEGQRMPEPVVEFARAVEALGDRLVVRRPGKPQGAQILAQMGPRHRPGTGEEAPWNRAPVRCDGPSLAGLQIDKGKGRPGRGPEFVGPNRCATDRRSPNGCRSESGGCRCPPRAPTRSSWNDRQRPPA